MTELRLWWNLAPYVRERTIDVCAAAFSCNGQTLNDDHIFV